MTRHNRRSQRAAAPRTNHTRALAVATLIVLAITVGLAASGSLHGRGRSGEDGDREGRKDYAIGLWGDLPYSDMQALTGVPEPDRRHERQDLAFTVHDGDLKARHAGLVPLRRRALYTQALGYFNALKAPAMFTPGDNDWTDCDRPRTAASTRSSGSTYERAAVLRTPFSLGQHQLRQQVQTTPLCLGVSGPRRCVENRRWSLGGVTYATLNVQGSCNNLCDTAPDPAEYAARNAGEHRLAAGDLRGGASARGSVGGHADRAGQSRLGPVRRDARAAARPARRSPRPTASRTASRHFLLALRDEVDRLPQAGRLRARRLALLPHRQAAARRAGPARSRTSRASRRSATTRRTATTTSTG